MTDVAHRYYGVAILTHHSGPTVYQNVVAVYRAQYFIEKGSVVYVTPRGDAIASDDGDGVRAGVAVSRSRFWYSVSTYEDLFTWEWFAEERAEHRAFMRRLRERMAR